MDKTSNKFRDFLICAVLALATFVAFEQVRDSEFVYDDGQYVTKNPQVIGGITFESVIWAFTTTYAANWHPLTWLSHMLDCQLFGLNPLWHHLTSLLFHVANTLLLFAVLKRMTGRIWPSAFVAAAFALHPLRVESVAWVAERKDVLSGFCWMLTMAAYVRYTEQPGIRRYLLVILALCLGLMAKPMIVTLPFVLLLLDYWPLGRFQGGHQSQRPRPKSAKSSYPKSHTWRLIREKIPLFFIAMVSSIVTYTVQQRWGAMVQVERLPLNLRISNALVSYVGYIAKMVYPSRLAVLYPYPVGGFAAWQMMISFMALVGVSVGLLYTLRRRRYLTVGWLWYLGTLVPVIGLVQVGVQSMADRYTYLPAIGIFIIVAWGAAGLFAKWRHQKIVLRILSGLVLAAMLMGTRVQVRHWKNSLTLYGHALAVTENNYIMQNNYGYAMLKEGRGKEAVIHIREALRIHPDYLQARRQLGYALTLQGKFKEAVREYQKVLHVQPDNPHALNGLGVALLREGKFDEAIACFIEALRIKPDYTEAQKNLRYVLNLRSRLNKEGGSYIETSPKDSFD